MHVSDVSSRQTARSAAEQTLRLQFTVILEKDGNSFHAFCPAFKGLHVDGKSELPVGPHCSVEEEQIPIVPPGALLRYLEIQWPSLSMSGIS